MNTDGPPKERPAVLGPGIQKLAKSCYHGHDSAQVCDHLSGYRLARLGMCERLTKWERNFVRDVSQRRKLTHRQQAIVDRLVAAYLEVGGAARAQLRETGLMNDAKRIKELLREQMEAE